MPTAVPPTPSTREQTEQARYVQSIQADLKAIQQALKEQGFYKGEPDGAWGQETEAAIMRWQVWVSKAATGKISGCKRRRQNPSLKRPESLVAPEQKYLGR